MPPAPVIWGQAYLARNPQSENWCATCGRRTRSNLALLHRPIVDPFQAPVHARQSMSRSSTQRVPLEFVLLLILAALALMSVYAFIF